MPIGNVTRGTTGYNRLRRVDRWIATLPVLRRTDDPLVADVGYGASPTTTLELRDRLAAVRPDVDLAGADLQQQLEQIRQQKLALGLQKDQLTYAQKYEGSVTETNNQYQEQIKKLTQMPVDFAKTTAQTAMSDFGISGQGALGALADYGMEMGSKFIFNVSNVDEAIAVKDNQIAKQSMGVVGR